MRKPLLIGISLGCLLAAPALGALATFEGLNPGSMGNEVWVDAGTDAQFNITLSVQTLAEFNLADLIIGSNEVPDLSFEFSPAWTAAMSTLTGPMYDNGFYAQDVYVGGSSTASVGTSLLLGTLTVKTDGLPDGDYIISIDGANDATSVLGMNADSEELNGFGTIHIPEPSCLGLLLAAGFIACLRRR